jgi:hypothetical protein
MMRQGTFLWLLGSGLLMVIGSLGPWVTALGISGAGTDIPLGRHFPSSGWWVVVGAAGGAGLSYFTRQNRDAGVWALLGGTLGAAATIHVREDTQSAIDRGGALGHALVHVGWGLNLALLASASMFIAGLAALAQARSAPTAVQPSPPTPESVSPEPVTQPETPRPATSSARDDLRSRLAALDSLRSEGVVTEDEYQQRRAAILESI